MQLLKDIDEAKAAAAAIRLETQALRDQAAALAQAIASAPVPRQYTVRLRDRDFALSEGEALAFTCVAMLALLDRTAQALCTLAGEEVEMMIGDVDLVARQIVAQTRGS